jgi:hypothetical protein
MSESNDKRWQEEEVREKAIIFLIQIQILKMWRKRRRSVGHWRRQKDHRKVHEIHRALESML